MDNLLTVSFEAHNAGRNHHRRYEIALGRDLLEDWTISVRYGRVGQGGQEQRYGSSNLEEIRAIMRDRLCRRLSAPRRIGCPYSLVGLIAAPGFDPSGWLPGEVMAKFFQAGAPRQPDASMNGTR